MGPSGTPAVGADTGSGQRACAVAPRAQPTSEWPFNTKAFSVKGAMNSPLYGLMTPFRNGTAPGIFASEQNAIKPSCEHRNRASHTPHKAPQGGGAGVRWVRRSTGEEGGGRGGDAGEGGGGT